jgi:hypothetical protein
LTRCGCLRIRGSGVDLDDLRLLALDPAPHFIDRRQIRQDRPTACDILHLRQPDVGEPDQLAHESRLALEPLGHDDFDAGGPHG